MSMIIALDPSINDAGYAVFKKAKNYSWYLAEYGVIEPEKSQLTIEWYERARSILFKLQSLVQSHREQLYRMPFEMPSTYSSGKGQIAKDSGGLQKLYFVCGMICGAFPDYVVPINVMDWKGQVTKEVTRAKMIAKYKIPDTMYSHEYDAIGIGDYFIRQLTQQQHFENNIKEIICKTNQ